MSFALLLTTVQALFKKYPLLKKGTEYSVVAFITFAIAFALFHHKLPSVVITQTTPTTTSVQVGTDALTPKIVTKYVQDDTAVKQLLAENQKLKIQVTQLSKTLAQSTSHGSGPVTSVPVSVVSPVLVPTPEQNTPTAQVTEFKDWHLHFVSDGTDARYELNQKFEIVDTTGRGKNGTPISQVKLYELGPQGQPLPIPTVKTTSVYADATRPHWFVSPTLTAGVAYTSDKKAGGVLGVRWLTRGRTKSAEDSSLSLLSPVVLLDATTKQAGILPISWNAGTKVPIFKDLWVSPYLGHGSKTTSIGGVTTSKPLWQFGFVIHASF